MTGPHTDPILDPDFGLLRLQACEEFAPVRGEPLVVRRTWRGQDEHAPFGVLIELLDVGLDAISESVRRDYRAILAQPDVIIEDLATRGHWRLSNAEAAVEDLKIQGITVTTDGLSVWLKEEPLGGSTIEVTVMGGVVAAVDWGE